MRLAQVIEFDCADCGVTVKAYELHDPEGVFAAAVETDRARMLCAPCFHTVESQR